MAKFLNTSATNYYLEELIKGARERLTIISPSSSSTTACVSCCKTRTA